MIVSLRSVDESEGSDLHIDPEAFGAGGHESGNGLIFEKKTEIPTGGDRPETDGIIFTGRDGFSVTRFGAYPAIVMLMGRQGTKKLTGN